MTADRRPVQPSSRGTVAAALAAAALACLLACGGPAQDSPPAAQAAPADPEALTRARAALGRGDAAGAVALLEPLVVERPELARAWLTLGAARQKAGDLDGALEADLKATGFPSTAGRAWYNAACVHALAGRDDDAFAALDRAREAGGIDLTGVPFDPDLASVKDDPRVADLFPDRVAFDDPFVETVRVIHEWHGEAAGDAFGWIARDAGDVDGDGIHDAVVSATGHDAGAGRVYLYSGGPGTLLWTHDGPAGGGLGTGLEAAGDVDGNGVPDVVAGAPGADLALVLSGVDGSEILRLTGAAGSRFGQAACGAGDVDGDGRNDVIVGAPGDARGGEQAGRAVVASGRDGSVLLDLIGASAGANLGSAVAGAGRGAENIVVVGVPGVEGGGRVDVHLGGAPEPSFVIRPPATGRRFGGMFVSVVGDVDADGQPDVYVSDWADAARGPSTGRIVVVSGADGRELLALGGEAAGDGFGIGPAALGDVDGDGHDDLVIGAWQQAGGAPGGGKVYVHSGADGHLLRTITSRVMGDTLGFDAIGLGDVDGDGRTDLLLTAAWSSVNGPRSGRTLVVAGEPH